MQTRSLILGFTLWVATTGSVSGSDLDELASALTWASSPTYAFELRRQDIQDLPIRGWRQALALSSEVVIDRRSGSYFVRGGTASDQELTINGVPMRDAFTGRIHMDVPNPAIEMITVQSYEAPRHLVDDPLVVSLRTEGYSVQPQVIVDGVTSTFHGDSDEHDVLSAVVHGATSRGPALTYNAAVERQWRGGDHWMWQGIVDYETESHVNTKFGTNGVDRDYRWLPMSFYFDSEHAPRTTLSDISIWNQSRIRIDAAMSLDATVDWHRVEAKTGDGLYLDNLWGYGRPDGQTRHDQTTLFWLWDDYRIDENGDQFVTPSYDTVITVPISDDGETRGVAFVKNDEGHVWDDYQTYEWSAVGGEARLRRTFGDDVESQLSLGYRRHTVRSYHNYFPVRIFLGTQGGFNDINAYGYDDLGNPVDSDDPLTGARHPTDASASFGTQYQHGRLRVLGVARLDRWDYDGYVFRNPRSPLDPGLGIGDPEELDASDLMRSHTHTRLSPALSATYIASRRTILLASVSRTYRRPDLRDLYGSFEFAAYKVEQGGYDVVLANAGLEPRETTECELAVRHRLAHNLTLETIGFYKDIKKLPGEEKVPTSFGPYTTIVSNRDAIARGVEFRGDFNPSAGSRSSVEVSCTAHSDWPRPSWQSPDYSFRFNYIPMPYDLRHRFVGIVNVAGERGHRTSGLTPFNRWAASLVFTAESGLPYTPTVRFNEVTLGSVVGVPTDALNSESMPAYYRVDLKLSTDVQWNSRTLNVYLWVLNLLDRNNAIDVYTGTGEPDNTGWLDTSEGEQFVQGFSVPTDNSGLTGKEKYLLRQNDPNNLDIGRQIRFGALLMF